eukprot:gene12837-biopygen12895
MTSHTPSDASTRNSSAPLIGYCTISGAAVMTALCALSPKLRLTATLPPTRFFPSAVSTIRPPQAAIRAASVSREGTWSLVRRCAVPDRHATAEQSPHQAMYTWVSTISATVQQAPLASQSGKFSHDCWTALKARIRASGMAGVASDRSSERTSCSMAPGRCAFTYLAQATPPWPSNTPNSLAPLRSSTHTVENQSSSMKSRLPAVPSPPPATHAGGTPKRPSGGAPASCRRTHFQSLIPAPSRSSTPLRRRSSSPSPAPAVFSPPVTTTSRARSADSAENPAGVACRRMPRTFSCTAAISGRAPGSACQHASTRLCRSAHSAIGVGRRCSATMASWSAEGEYRVSTTVCSCSVVLSTSVYGTRDVAISTRVIPTEYTSVDFVMGAFPRCNAEPGAFNSSGAMYSGVPSNRVFRREDGPE